VRITCALGPYLPVPPLLGGAVEKVFLGLCEEFARLGHEVTILSRRHPDLPDSEMRNGIRHIRIPSRNAPKSRFAYRVFDFAYALRVARNLPHSDITITNSISMPLVLPKARAGKIYVSVARFPKGQMSIYRRADRLQAVSTPVAEAIREQSPSVASLVKVIPNTLSSTFAAALAAPSPGERTREIIYVGRVAREKGLELLFAAYVRLARSHPDWRLRVIGPSLTSQGGDGEAYVAELKFMLPTDVKVKFEGPVFDESALRARYEQAAIFVYPSVAETGESFGLAPLEAMACGCATVVSDLACFRDFVAPGVNAIVFDHRNASGDSLVAALEALITDPVLRGQLVSAAKETCRDYTPAPVAKLFIDDFRLLLERRS
jgi:glycosyltransferase involved in cell wall biosynthesis